MASIENRSHFQVTVKNRDDLTKSFTHNSKPKAEQYFQSLETQKFKPKPSRLDDNYIIRIRKTGLEDQVIKATSLEEAKLIKSKLEVEHEQGLLIDYERNVDYNKQLALKHVCMYFCGIVNLAMQLKSPRAIRRAGKGSGKLPLNHTPPRHKYLMTR